ncbi:MAG: group II intron maturase-specific domain-containing protein, partial [Mycobacterium sp.]
VVMCATRQEAEWVLSQLTAILAEMGLEPKASKTRIVHLEEGGDGIEFLGFHHRWVRARSSKNKNVKFLARWPSDKAMARIRERVRQLTDRSRLVLPIEWIVEHLNQVLRGWAEYFRYGNSAERFDKLQSYVRMRLALLIAKKHRRSRAFGWSVLAFQSSGYLGLLSLDGIVVAPRPFRDWRGKPNAGGERRR